MQFNLSLSPKKIASVLIGIVIFFIFGHLLTVVLNNVIGPERIPGSKMVIQLLNLDKEGNIPAWYSSSMLLICAILLLVIAVTKKQAKDRYQYHWFGLGLIFVALSLDEAASIHEYLSYLRHFFNTSGVLHYAWIIPAAVALVIIGIAYFKFVFDLPPHIRNLFIAAGTVFVSGAIGFEMISGALVSSIGHSHFILIMLEETFEMSGIIIFVYALTSYLKLILKDVKSISISVEQPTDNRVKVS